MLSRWSAGILAQLPCRSEFSFVRPSFCQVREVRLPLPQNPPCSELQVSVPYWIAAAPGAYARRDLPSRPPALEAGHEEIERLVTRQGIRGPCEGHVRCLVCCQGLPGYRAVRRSAASVVSAFVFLSMPSREFRSLGV